jgi:hypothetical protein
MGEPAAEGRQMTTEEPLFPPHPPGHGLSRLPFGRVQLTNDQPTEPHQWPTWLTLQAFRGWYAHENRLRRYNDDEPLSPVPGHVWTELLRASR